MNLTCPNCNQKATQQAINKISQGNIQCSYCDTEDPIHDNKPNRRGHTEKGAKTRKSAITNEILLFVITASVTFGFWHIGEMGSWLAYLFMAIFGLPAVLSFLGLLQTLLSWIKRIV